MVDGLYTNMYVSSFDGNYYYEVKMVKLIVFPVYLVTSHCVPSVFREVNVILPLLLLRLHSCLMPVVRSS